MSVTPEREGRIFNVARKLPVEEQALYVQWACAEDTLLRQRVEELLQANAAVGAFLPELATAGESFPKPAAARATAATVPQEQRPWEQPGDTIGRYKLLEKLGEGGCGVVYVAEQKEPVRRRVALKVIKLGMDTRSVIARFEAERQALALMDHPNIAKVLDAGATETGRPYFVMELVRGVRITEYCDQHRLSPRQRLDLFIEVCHAIQHAHQKGIIHRDIKPSNILVTVNDGVAFPIVIDFGIAKATAQQRLTDKTLYTAFEQFIGTPAYMSPEQAEMTNLDIDTRSDIYALGVLLYELLTGRTPFDAKTLVAAGLDEMRRIIREQEPVRPSTRLNTLGGEELTTAARRRSTEAPKLVHLVRGDLDWIVMKCLEKDRRRRYEAANDVARDIERHLNNEAVTARPPSAAYRVQKFVRRNKVMVTAGTAIAAALVLGVVVSTWQAVRASRLRAKAEANEQKALQAQANEAKQREMAQAERDRARLEAYVGDMKIADAAWRANNLGEAMTALRRHMPKPGETDVRGIEWRYLWQKCQGQQSKIFKHEAEVICADLSPDGRWLATESGGGFWVWDTTREGERRVLSSNAPDWDFLDPAEHVVFDPQDHFLATATSSEVLIWTVTDWRKLKSLPATNANLAFSSDGTTMATFGDEGIQVWKVATWEPLVRPGEIKVPSLGCRRIALNHDGSLLAECQRRVLSNESDADEEVALWSVPQRQLLFTGRGVRKASKLAFSDDNHSLAACTVGPPAMVCSWSVPEGKPGATWLAGQGLGRALAFAPGGRVLATAGTDQVISLWETGHTNR